MEEVQDYAWNWLRIAVPPSRLQPLRRAQGHQTGECNARRVATTRKSIFPDVGVFFSQSNMTLRAK